MKKKYMAPAFEVELYELDAAIASNCANVVHNGPAMGKHTQCDDYENPYDDLFGSASLQSVYNVNFYVDTNCDCYTTGSDSGYWQS